MKNVKKSKMLLSIPFIFSALVFSSCGSVRSAESLYRKKSWYIRLGKKS